MAACCGLRASEISGLKVQNIKLAGRKPSLYIPKAIARRKKQGTAPLWLDQGTLDYSQDAKKAGETYDKRLTIHHGRHSFCSHALADERVRDAAGHVDISTTSVYMHIVGTDEGVGTLFDFLEPCDELHTC